MTASRKRRTKTVPAPADTARCSIASRGWRRARACLAAAAIAGGGPVSAQPAIEAGGLRVEFDAADGRPTRIAQGGESLALPPREALPFTFGVGPTNRVAWLHDMKLGRRLARWQCAGPSAEAVVRCGDFEVVERYQVHADPPRLDRSARLTWRGADTLKLRGAAFQTAGLAAPPGAFARFPERWPPEPLNLSDLKPGDRRGGSGTTAPLVAVLRPGRSLLWLSCTDDMPATHVTRSAESIVVSQGLAASGHLRPGQTQDFGTVSMLVAEGGYRDALALAHRWLAAMGVATPADRADWVSGAAMYAFHPGGTIGSQWKDLGGFRASAERLAPSLARLGVTAAWVLPVEYRSPYWPLDYYRFMDGLGSEDEYRALVARLHAAGLKVIQDIVPHGGSPEAAHNKAHPEFMLRREDGSTLGYWLNDFARADWRDFISGVAAHNVRAYGIDGYRVDACMGSKEPNWDPAIPYARASLAGLWGGLRMVERIRATVKGIKPAEGAILAETQSVRHAPFCDFMYDFRFCYEILHGWRTMPAAAFASALAEHLEDQRQLAPPGTLWLRHVESHDSLRAQLWHGVEGMRAMYALSAWIDGVPMIYQEMEKGHAFALRRINDLRRARPELARGDASYRDVTCDTPGVFACLRTLGDRRSVAVINFNREPIAAKLSWPGGSDRVNLPPLGYTLLPPPEPQPAERPPDARPPEARAIGGDVMTFEGAEEWFVDTAEGRLRDAFVPLRPGDLAESSSIYRRPQGTPDIWRQDMQPLHLGSGRIGVRRAGKGWTLLSPKGAPGEALRLAERHGGKACLAVAGLTGCAWDVSAAAVAPPAPDPTHRVDFGGVTLRVVGPDYIVENGHYEAVLGRQGGVLRSLRARGKTLARDWDLYGDQAYFRTEHAGRMNAASDVESAIRISRGPEGKGLLLAFDGQIRGTNRFARKRPGLLFRTEYRFDASARFRQAWSFGTEKSFRDQMAFLAMWVEIPEAERVRFLRGGVASFDGALSPSRERSGQTRGGPAPDAIEFGGPGGGFALRLAADPDVPCNFFMQGRRLFAAFLEGKGAAMDQGRRYAFAAEWDTAR